MAENSKIEWTTHTFNPWIGCTKVSPGCDFCYAEARMDHRLHAVQWGAHGERKRTTPTYWKQPLLWDRKAREAGVRHRVFCASLADVFDNQAPVEWRADLWHLIKATPNLDWLLLTKRPQNIAKMLPPGWGDGWPNVWLGTSVENRDEMLRRGPVLKAVPAAVHFWSSEPLLSDLGEIPSGIIPSWIIVGGESGPGARPMHPGWPRSIRDQCAAAGVPFFFKQVGEWGWPSEDQHHADYAAACNGKGAWPHDKLMQADGSILPGDSMKVGSRAYIRRVGKKAAGRLLDGREHNGFPVIGGAA